MSSNKNKKKIKISKNLKLLRKINNLTAEELANFLQLELSAIRCYELQGDMPAIINLKKLADFFGISIDFLILGKETPYIHSTRLLHLASKIDKLDMNERYKVEASTSALLKKDSKFLISLDNIPINLTPSFHQNLKLIRKEKNISQTVIANKIGVSRVQVSLYEKKSYPRLAKLIKISTFMKVSIHALLTGQKLIYDFSNKGLRSTILKADKLLSLEEVKFLIHLMQRIIEDSEQ